MKALPYILVVSLLSWMGSAAWAAVGRPVMDSAGNIIDAQSHIKTPRLETSDRIRILLEKHNTFPISNWAGFRLKFHIRDSKEVSVTPGSTLFGIAAVATPAGGTATVRTAGSLVEPDFPQSTLTPRSSFTRFRTVWHPRAQQSGRHLPPSAWFPLVDLELHAKSTTPKNNSDVDLTVMAWNIRHLRGTPGSTTFEPSALVWADSDYVPHQPEPGGILQLPPPIPTDATNGHWVHIPFPWHVPPGMGISNFVATLAGTAFIGIEHVPEPMTAVMAGGGVLLLVCGWGLRRRRLSM